MEKRQYLLLVRHGESQANVVTQVETDAHHYELTGSDVEVGLTTDGWLQSEAAADRIALAFPGDNAISRLLVSPFARVRLTAGAIERKLAYPVVMREDARLSKRSYGAFWNLSYKGVAELHPHEFARFQQTGKLLYRAPGGGENYPDVFTRVDSFIDEEVMPSTGNLLIVTHSVVALAFQRRFEGLPDDELVARYERVALPNCHILVYCREGVTGHFSPCALPCG